MDDKNLNNDKLANKERPDDRIGEFVNRFNGLHTPIAVITEDMYKQLKFYCVADFQVNDGLPNVIALSLNTLFQNNAISFQDLQHTVETMENIIANYFDAQNLNPKGLNLNTIQDPCCELSHNKAKKLAQELSTLGDALKKEGTTLLATFGYDTGALLIVTMPKEKILGDFLIMFHNVIESADLDPRNLIVLWSNLEEMLNVYEEQMVVGKA